MSTVGRATYQTAKYVSKIRTPHNGNILSYIWNSSDFVEKPKNITVEENEVIASLDISLFTSAPGPGIRQPWW